MIKNVSKSPSYIEHVDNENYKKKGPFFPWGKNNSLGRFKPQTYKREIVCNETSTNITFSNNAIIIKHVSVESQSIL